MKQLAHIFCKDVRRLRLEIALVWILQAWFVRSAILQGGSTLLEDVLMLSWWFLIAQLVHGEGLTSSTEFWLTRPYRRASLAGAKLTLTTVVIVLPFAISDLCIVGGSHLAMSGHWGAWACHLAMATTLFLVPAFGLACVTSSTAQMFLAILAVGFAAFVTEAFANPIRLAAAQFANADEGWVVGLLCASVAVIAAAVIVPLQYRARRTGWARSTAIVALAVAGLGYVATSHLNAAPKLQAAWTPRQLPASVALQPVPIPAHTSPTPAPGSQPAVWLRLPLQLAGVPTGDTGSLMGRGSLRVIDPATGNYLALWIGNEGDWMGGVIWAKDFATWKDRLVTLRAEIPFTVEGETPDQVVSVEDFPRDVPGVGWCEWDIWGRHASCRSAFQLPAWRMGAGADPLPARFGLNPVQLFWAGQRTDMSNLPPRAWKFQPRPVLARLYLTADVPNVRLRDLVFNRGAQ